MSKATFKIASWEEAPVHELADGAKVTRASVVQTYEGEIQGQGSVEYVMFHRGEGWARFVGFELFQGSLSGRSGSVVLEHTGVFEEGAARSRWKVIAGSGTSELEGVDASGSFAAGDSGTAEVSFEVETKEESK